MEILIVAGVIEIVIERRFENMVENTCRNIKKLHSKKFNKMASDYYSHLDKMREYYRIKKQEYRRQNN
jgi:hypothetical protein